MFVNKSMMTGSSEFLDIIYGKNHMINRKPVFEKLKNSLSNSTEELQKKNNTDNTKDGVDDKKGVSDSKNDSNNAGEQDSMKDVEIDCKVEAEKNVTYNHTNEGKNECMIIVEYVGDMSYVKVGTTYSEIINTILAELYRVNHCVNNGKNIVEIDSANDMEYTIEEVKKIVCTNVIENKSKEECVSNAVADKITVYEHKDMIEDSSVCCDGKMEVINDDDNDAVIIERKNGCETSCTDIEEINVEKNCVNDSKNFSETDCVVLSKNGSVRESKNERVNDCDNVSEIAHTNNVEKNSKNIAVNVENDCETVGKITCVDFGSNDSEENSRNDKNLAAEIDIVNGRENVDKNENHNKNDFESNNMNQNTHKKDDKDIGEIEDNDVCDSKKDDKIDCTSIKKIDNVDQDLNNSEKSDKNVCEIDLTNYSEIENVKNYLKFCENDSKFVADNKSKNDFKIGIKDINEIDCVNFGKRVDNESQNNVEENVNNKVAEVVDDNTNYVDYKKLSEEEKKKLAEFCCNKFRVKKKESLMKKTIKLFTSCFRPKVEIVERKEKKINDLFYKLQKIIAADAYKHHKIFRKSFDENDAERLWNEMKSNNNVDDIFFLVGLYKWYIRTNMNGLFSGNISEGFKLLYRNIHADCTEKEKAIQYLIFSMSPEEKDILENIFVIFDKIAGNYDTTGMDMQSLIICIAPSLFDSCFFAKMQDAKTAVDVINALSNVNLNKIDVNLYNEFINNSKK